MTRLASDRRGAAYVEFLIAIVPFFLFVLCVLQGALLQLGHLVTERAADAAARSAVVVLDDDPQRYGGAARNSPTGARLDTITRAADNVLAALPGTSAADRAAALTVDVAASGPDGPVTVRVGYRFRCAVPLARLVVCSGSNGSAPGTFQIDTQATLPNQGSRYAYAGGGQ
ncbi:MAG TPA: hypothetical protein VK698_14215 [Kofleriaceae bacterium]|nr:hypothetical protein [Kofleriaceae bacterium]